MKEKLKDILFYGGVDEASYENVKDEINHVNRTLVNVVSGLASVLITALFLLSYSLSGIGMNHMVYGIGSAISILMLIASLLFAEKYPRIIGALVHLSYIIFYAYGILIGTVTDPDGKTVTFMVMLVFLPTLFTIPPVQTISISFTCEIIFIFLCFQTKTGAVLNNDVVDAIIFGFLGSISGVLLVCMKIRSHVNEFHLREVSRSDKLTGMNNRNAYELDIHTIPKNCKKSLACVYIDVNGLKIANDNQGHKAGDKMLVSVARIILKYFGDYYAYRIGGDEFIVFIPDIKSHALASSIAAMKNEIEENKYHIAIGYDKQNIGGLSMGSLTKNAEAMMYQDKLLYYKDSEHERRHH